MLQKLFLYVAWTVRWEMFASDVRTLAAPILILTPPLSKVSRFESLLSVGGSERSPLVRPGGSMVGRVEMKKKESGECS